MSKLKIRQGDWVVVCDGKKALVLENVGRREIPQPQDQEGLRARRSEDAASSAPMRRPLASARSAAGRSAMEQTDWHEQEEQRFLHKLVGQLDAAVNAGEAKALIMVAPPRALGVLRQAYSHNLREALRAEIDKDLVKLPVHEIEKHLAG